MTEEIEPDNKDLAELKIVEDCVARLREHFETVEIFVTTIREKRTRSLNSGAGNYYARIGQIKEWIIRDEEFVRNDARQG